MLSTVSEPRPQSDEFTGPSLKVDMLLAFTMLKFHVLRLIFIVDVLMWLTMLNSVVVRLLIVLGVV